METTFSQSAPSSQDKILREQVELLYGGLKIALAISLLVSVFLVIVQLSVINHTVLLIWFSVMFLLVGLRAGTYILFQRRSRFTLSLRHWYQIFIAGVLLASLMWASSLIWLFPQDDLKHQSFVVFALVGMCSGGVATLSFRRETALIFIGPIIAVLCWRFISLGDVWGISLALAAILYFAGLTFSGQHIYRNTLQNIELRVKSTEQSQALEHSEQRLRTIVDSAADAFFLHDKKGRFADVNLHACQSLGYTRQELLQLSVADIELTTEKDNVQQHWDELENGKVVTLPGLHRRKDGSTFPVEVRLGVLFEHGEKMFSVLAKDMTETLRTNGILKLREEQARAQYKGIPAPTYTWQKVENDFVLIDFNDAAERFTGGAVADYLGIRLLDMYADNQMIREDIWRCFEGQQPIQKQMPYYYKHIDQHKQLDVKYAYIPPDMVIVHTEDITERIRAEQIVHDHRAQLAEAQRIAKLGNWEWDLVTGRIDWSDEVYRILGFDKDRDESSQENFLKVIHPDDLKLMQESEQRAYQGEPHFDEEWRIITTGGVLKYIHLRGERYFNEQQQLVRMVGTLQDVTERKQAEILKSEFISTVSHEIRTPLTSIMGSLSIMKNGIVGQFSDEAGKMIRIAYENSQRLLVLINDILDISRIESGKMAFDFKPVDVISFIQRAITANQGYAEHHHVEYRFDNNIAGTVQVMGDADRLMQVMNNLFSNAAKFSAEGSAIDIKAECKGGHACISVADRGPGITSDFADKVFERFSQDDASSQRTSGGTGLGLNISKHIVEKHQGAIGFEPRPGGGTIFHVSLPLFRTATINIHTN